MGDDKRMAQQQSTASGRSASVRIVGDGNTVIQQPQTDGTVVAVYMPQELESIIDHNLNIAICIEVDKVFVRRGDTVQPNHKPLASPLASFGPYHFPFSPVAGVIESVHVSKGDSVSEDTIATVRVWDAA